MRRILILFLFLLSFQDCYAQTTAPDFSAIDCKGNGHTLYGDLAQNKFIILVWIMPCHYCNPGGSAAFSAMADINAKYPGKVSYYLIDDDGYESCNELAEWAVNVGIDTSKITIFRNADMEIYQRDYGGYGMPHITLVAPDKKIYYNELDGAGDGILEALFQATSIKQIDSELLFSIFPNPAKDRITISSKKQIEEVAVWSISGQITKQFTPLPRSQNHILIDLSECPNGSYFLLVRDVSGAVGRRTIVKKA